MIAGVDPEGARNGLYAFMERLGFGFFRDGETMPALQNAVELKPDVEVTGNPAFRWRGDMIWDNYLGPKRYCAAVWDEAAWERALLWMARRGLNFLEFYPPLERVLSIAFPDARGLDHGSVWTSSFKHALAQRVLARGRELGIRFMYVLNYGFFPEPIRALYPNLEWANGHLCANQPQLAQMAGTAWRVLVAELGTDHLYAIRHRGEEGQSYSDPCRSVTKAAGFRQAIGIVETIDPNATITVWTWGETLPDLFAALPSTIHAAHIRHGMGGVLAERGAGREQSDGSPSLPAGRSWLSGQFTVFGGNETGLQTPWSDADALARDARAARRSRGCEGYFQWPEWSSTSPWMSEVIARLASDAGSFVGRDREFRAYAERRHGPHAGAFLAAALPLVRAGNARVTSTPRKRLFVPYLLSPDELTLLDEVRSGVRGLSGTLLSAESPLLDRDFVDLSTWIAVRQAHVFEAAGYLAHLAHDKNSSTHMIAAAEICWTALHDLLAEIPELSIVESARMAARTGPVSDRFVESFWTNACDFYHGYPLVMSPEAIELVYLDQLHRLGARLREAESRETLAALDPPGWFWHDFPDPAWAETVRKLPDEDASNFEHVMTRRLMDVFNERPDVSVGASRATAVIPRASSRVDASVASRFVDRMVRLPLPAPLTTPPAVPAPTRG